MDMNNIINNQAKQSPLMQNSQKISAFAGNIRKQSQQLSQSSQSPQSPQSSQSQFSSQLQNSQARDFTQVQMQSQGVQKKVPQEQKLHRSHKQSESQIKKKFTNPNLTASMGYDLQKNIQDRHRKDYSDNQDNTDFFISKKLNLALGVLFAVAFVVIGVFFFLTNNNSSNSLIDIQNGRIAGIQTFNSESVKKIIKEHIVVPNEEPQVLMVDDPELVKMNDPDFFKGLDKGDYVLIYSTKIVIFDISEEKVMAVSNLKSKITQNQKNNFKNLEK